MKKKKNFFFLIVVFFFFSFYIIKFLTLILKPCHLMRDFQNLKNLIINFFPIKIISK